MYGIDMKAWQVKFNPSLFDAVRFGARPARLSTGRSVDFLLRGECDERLRIHQPF